MKKTITLIIAFLAFSYCINAQTVLLHEGFNDTTLTSGWTLIDNDGDGHNWTMGYPPSEIVLGDTGGCIYSESYDVDFDTPLTPDNWLISPPIPITAGSILTFYVRGNDQEYPAEHYGVFISTTGTDVGDFNSVFEDTSTSTYEQKRVNLSPYVGNTIYVAFRHYNITDQNRLNLDEVEITQLPTSINVLQTNISFRTEVNSALVQEVNVEGYNLTDDITVTVTSGDMFSVSADSANFASTATLPSMGGTLYIQYLPTTIGMNYGKVTLTSTGATDVTLNLTGEGVHFLLEENFDACVQPDGWKIIDADSDAYNWVFDYFCNDIAYTHNGSKSVASSSSFIPPDISLTPDNWLITPPITLSNPRTYLSFWVAGQDVESFMENYGVYVSTMDNTDVGNFTSIFEGTSIHNWTEQILPLDDYVGQTIYIAFRHWNSTNFRCLKLDDVSVFNMSTEGIEDHTLSNSLLLYPNPTSNYLEVKFAQDLRVRGVTVYDVYGRLLRTVQINENPTRINVSDLSSGVYFVSAATENGIATKSFIKK